MHPPTILMYGTDAGLLHTRALVLQRAGYRVTAVQDWGRAEASPVVDLVILCHTLGQKERQKALASASDHWPAAEKLCLTKTAAGDLDCDHTFQCLQGPEQLIRTVGKLLVL